MKNENIFASGGRGLWRVQAKACFVAICCGADKDVD